MMLVSRFISFLLLAFPIVIISIKVAGPLIYLLLSLLGIYVAMSRRVSPFQTKELSAFSWLTLTYFMVMALSIALSNEPTNSWMHLGRKLQFLLAPFVVLAIFSVDISMDRFVRYIKAGAIVIGLIVSLQYLYDSSGGRFAGMFNPNTFGDLATMLTLFSVIRVTEESREEFWLSLVALVSGTVAVVMSGSRGAELSFFVMLLIYALVMHWMAPRGRSRSWISAAVAIVTFVTIYLGTGTDNKRFSIIETQVAQWSSEDDSSSSVGVRLEMYRSGLRAFADSMIIGYGYRNSTAVASRYTDDQAKEHIASYTHLHNEYITNMVSAGILGLVSLLLLLGIPLLISIRSLGDENRFCYAMMGVILISGYATLGITHGMLEWEYENSFFLLFLAYLMPKLLTSSSTQPIKSI